MRDTTPEDQVQGDRARSSAAADVRASRRGSTPEDRQLFDANVRAALASDSGTYQSEFSALG